MSTQIPTQNIVPGEKKKHNFLPNTAGAITGLAVGSVATPFTDKLLSPNIAKLNNLDKDTIELLHNKASEAIEQNGLKEFGVNIKYLEPLGEQEKPKSFSEKLMHKFDIIMQTRNGKNACFLNQDLPGVNLATGQPVVLEKANTILMPKTEMSLQSFHEIGHAVNFNQSGIGKALQKIRPLSIYLGFAPLVYGAFTKKAVAKDNEELSTGQKTKNFIRDNAGKLAFLVMVPIVIEEAMASHKGEKIAEKMLSKDLVQKLSKSNKIALMSYIGTAALAGLGTWAGIKIKDKLVK